MNVSNAVQPTPEQFQQFLSSDFAGPVCMGNLLKFKDKAEYADGRETSLTAIVEYPSKEAFFEIATSPDVQGFGVHRSAWLAGQLLIATSQAEIG